MEPFPSRPAPHHTFEAIRETGPAPAAPRIPAPPSFPLAWVATRGNEDPPIQEHPNPPPGSRRNAGLLTETPKATICFYPKYGRSWRRPDKKIEKTPRRA